MERLDHYLLSDIMMRLPVKPLGQLKSVCKPWNRLISRPSFIKSYMNRSFNMQDDEILLFLCDSSYYDNHNCSMHAHHIQSLDELEIPDFIRLPSCIPESQYKSIIFYGSVNGLICINYRPYDPELRADWELPSGTSSIFVIWNPSLSAVSTLPQCIIPFRNLEDHPTDSHVRFGYDSQNNDYKIVKVMGRLKRGQPEAVVIEWLPVEVFSMRRGTWELIPRRFPPHVVGIVNNDRCCTDGYDGHIHWLGTIKLGGRVIQTIVAFDLDDESFREILLPRGSSKRTWEGIGVFGGKLCLMSLLPDKKCEVWVMNEYREPSSWVRMNVISELSGVARPCGFTLSNKLLFANSQGRRFRLYDPVTGEVKHVVKTYWDLKVTRSVNSLAWIAPPREVQN